MRLDVKKTYKLFIGGKFPRSESGRSYQVNNHKGEHLANVALASRKDVRDAVVAARVAQPGWAAASAYNRGQILYRIAEMLEGRRDQFIEEIRELTGKSEKQASQEVDAAIDSWVWHAGWSDKIDSVAGSMNPVAGPFFNISTNQPTGVVGAFAPQDSPLVGFVNTIAPAIVSGNTVVAVTSETLSLPALTLGEVLATSDLPGGVVNILSGKEAELSSWIVSHMDVNAVDLEGTSNPVDLEIAAAGTVKRVIRPETYARTNPKGLLQHILSLLEVKTVWHPKGH
jgi:acyl-CoA reductase-like NAD-dependent aldehyde dehydrogenase